jgi:hypothetical protein
VDPVGRKSTWLAVALAAVASAATLVGLQANNAAFLGVFPALGYAALVLPVRLSVVVVGAALVSVSVAWLSNGRAPIVGIISRSAPAVRTRCVPAGKTPAAGHLLRR